MENNVYTKHQKAFRDVQAWVIICKDTNEYGEEYQIGTVAFKSSEQQCVSYFHVYGSEMKIGIARGYGYCKTDAAVSKAVEKILTTCAVNTDKESYNSKYITDIKQILNDDTGEHWYAKLRDAGYKVYQAV